MYKKQLWDLGSLKESFARYLAENGRYPTSDEIDSVDYLPSARQIQRVFGGLVNLRDGLGLKITDYTKGETRSLLSSMINSRGNDIELALELELVDIFGRFFVHTERKISDTGKSRFDFYLFTKQGEMGVDVFYPSSINLLKAVINHKQTKYKGFLSYPIYFVCANKTIEQSEIDSLINQKVNRLEDNMRVCAYEDFIKEMRNIVPLQVQ